MPTTNTFTIGRNPDGNYTNVAAWYAARSGNLIDGDRVEIGQLLSGALTNQNAPFGAAVTGPTNFMRIIYATNRYSSTNGTGPRIVQDASQQWTISDSHMQIIGIGYIDQRTGGNDGISIEGGATNCLIDGVAYEYAAPQPPDGGNTRGWMRFNAAGTANNTIRNCTLINLTNATNGVPNAIRINAGADSNRVYNNTIVGHRGTGVNNQATNSQIWNNIAVDSGVVDFNFTGANSTNNYNLSSDATATGANSVVSQTVLGTLSNPTNGVFTLAGSSGAEAAGVDLSAQFTNDYYSNTRDFSWDIGAVAIVAPGSVNKDFVGWG